jgi:energy-coupling factor transport system ATP-binding protein
LARGLSARGCALVIATHDVEFAAGFADRVVLLARGRVIADGQAREILSDGLHFSTEVSRLTDGVALTAEDLSLRVEQISNDLAREDSL